jgi:2'-5' RNA ligase
MQNNSDTQIRAFFAIDLPPELKTIISKIIAQLKPSYKSSTIRWIPLENLHITLKFIATLKVNDIQGLLENIHNHLEIKPFSLTLTRLAPFPNTTRPTVIAFEMTHQANLANMAQIIKSAIAAAGYPVENRSFRAHLTLGKIKKPISLAHLDKIQLPNMPEIIVNNVTLFRSEPGKECSYYYPIETIDIA